MPSIDLAGKRALVTGAGRGIGQGCAVALAEAGADVVVNDLQAATAEATCHQISALGRRSWAVAADAFSRSGCEQIVQTASSHLGQIDILISNPAATGRGTLLEMPPDDFERIIRGTLTAGFHIGQLVPQRMVEAADGGAMVFITSVQGSMPYARSIAYNAAKAGLNHMVRSMAVEFILHRIRVNGIEPGWIDTPGERAEFGDERVDEGGRTLPLGRLGQPADIGQAATYLASTYADYVTGEILRVDGGYVWKDC